MNGGSADCCISSAEPKNGKRPAGRAFVSYGAGCNTLVLLWGRRWNTSRLVVRRDYQVKNGDYNVLLLLFGGVGTAITLFVARDSMVSLLLFSGRQPFL